MTIAIGSDHAGFPLKEVLVKYLKENNYEVLDMGTHSEDSVDYPDYGHAVATAVLDKKSDLGVLICGSGNGITMTANKHQGIRAALCWQKDIAEMARLHNDANILGLPGRYISEEEGLEMLKIFLTTSFEGGRHQKRLDKMPCQ